jgi:hypothetical protein
VCVTTDDNSFIFLLPPPPPKKKGGRGGERCFVLGSSNTENKKAGKDYWSAKIRPLILYAFFFYFGANDIGLCFWIVTVKQKGNCVKFGVCSLLLSSDL